MDLKTRRMSCRGSRCLICCRPCSSDTSVIDGGFLGAVHCGSLQRHLQQYFVAHYLLDIPTPWCEDQLRRREGQSPDSWFKLCDICLMVVSEAWQIRQKVLQLESRLKSIKEDIRNDMVKSIKAKSKQSESGQGIDEDIRKLLFPDLMANSNVKIEHRGFDGDDDDYDNDLGHISLDDFSDRDSDGNNAAPKGSALRRSGGNRRKKNKRKRGRYKEKTKKEILFEQASFHWKICAQCPSRFSNSEEYDAHMDAHQKAETDDTYVCKLCGFPGLSDMDLNMHVNNKHTDKKPSKTLYKCPRFPQCDFRTQVWKNLKSHIEEEHPDIPKEELAKLHLDLKCRICSKEFETKSTLVIHQKKMHPELFGAETTSLQCEHCSLLFPDSIRLRYHIKSEHYRVNRFICDDCGKGFSYLKHLERHKISHQKDKPREFVCHICGCDYSYASILQEHYRKFHPESKRKSNLKAEEDGGESSGEPGEQQEFSCKYCDMKTPFRTVLIRHMQTHKMEMGFHCDLCGKSYTTQQGLKRHKNINHSDNKVNCPHCLKPFPHIDYMKSHLRLYCKLKTINQSQADAGKEVEDTDDDTNNSPATDPSIVQDSSNNPSTSNVVAVTSMGDRAVGSVPIVTSVQNQPFEIAIAFPKVVKMEIAEGDAKFFV